MRGLEQGTAMAVTMVLGLACGSAEFFVCDANSDCIHAGNGVCQPNGFCSFPDAMCESGQRYGEAAAGGFAGMCVEPGDSATTSGTGSTASSTSADAGSSAAQSSSESGELTATTEPVTASTSTADSTGTGGSPGCSIAIEDQFDVPDLDPFWREDDAEVFSALGGRGIFTIEGGSTDYGNIRSDEFSAQGVWLMVDVSERADQEFTEFVIAFENGMGSVDIVIRNGRIIAREWTSSSAFEDLAETEWSRGADFVRLREDNGHVLFETSGNGEDFDAFFVYDRDIRSWQVEFAIWIGAIDNNPIDDRVVLESASVCAGA